MFNPVLNALTERVDDNIPPIVMFKSPDSWPVFTILLLAQSNRPAMSSTQPRKAKTSCALKFK